MLNPSRLGLSALSRFSRTTQILLIVGYLGLIFGLAGIYAIAGMPFGWALIASWTSVLVTAICIYRSI